jgi:hypothetical protein
MEAMLECVVADDRTGDSAEFALPRSPDGIESPVTLAGRQLAEFVVCLLGELEDVVGNGQAVVPVVEDGEKVVRADARARGVGNEEGTTGVARGGEGVHVKVALALVVRPQRCDGTGISMELWIKDGGVGAAGGWTCGEDGRWTTHLGRP